MKTRKYSLFLIFILVLSQGCNTLYNTKVVDLEIMEPGSVYLSPKYKNIAVKYNNCNVDLNPFSSGYYINHQLFTDSSKTDLTASKIYYDLFVDNLTEPQFFDTIIQLEPSDYSQIQLIDTLIIKTDTEGDTTTNKQIQTPEEIVEYFTDIIDNFLFEKKDNGQSKTIDPKFGLYTEREIIEIADSTNADVLFSLDYYSSLDGIIYNKENVVGMETVHILTIWNIYDLHKRELQNVRAKMDTVSWRENAFTYKELKSKLPPRKDAIYNAADVAGTGFAQFLVPHWTKVQRMYYGSGQTELRKTDELILENRWREAAKIWKANIKNPNKSIAAKSRYNMGIVCEIEGDFDAALDWVIQSFQVFGAKNEQHFYNCQQYIKILSQRKLDVKKIEKQFRYTEEQSTD